MYSEKEMIFIPEEFDVIQLLESANVSLVALPGELPQVVYSEEGSNG
ncbi:hypothetical protein KW794_03510 [Candidatus Saccharibacteria bacterium]|nr:hypothetical protein [Candidatus Saccharibacteria bacterium]